MSVQAFQTWNTTLNRKRKETNNKIRSQKKRKNNIVEIHIHKIKATYNVPRGKKILKDKKLIHNYVLLSILLIKVLGLMR